MPTNLPSKIGRYQIRFLTDNSRHPVAPLQKCALKGCTYPRRIDSCYCTDHQGMNHSATSHNDIPAISE